MNNLVITGNIVRDPELKTTNNGKMMCKFTVANNEGYGDYKKTSYFNCVAWGGTAEFIAEKCLKGEKVLVQGQFTMYKKDDKVYWNLNVVQFEKLEWEKKENNNSNQYYTQEQINDEDIPF